MCTTGKPSNSFVRLNVIHACEATIQEIKEFRQSKIEQIIRPLMIPRKKYRFFGPLICRSAKEARDSCGSTWQTNFALCRATNAFSGSYMIAEEILQMAKALGGDFISLTRDEFTVISSHYHPDIS